MAGMYVPTLRNPFGDVDTAPNPTPWVAGAILLLLAVTIPKLTKRIPVRAR